MFRRALTLGVVGVTALTTAGALLAGPAAAAEPTPSSYSSSSARWLDDQLTNGLAETFGFPDYGLSLDVWLALDGVGARPATRDAIWTSVVANQLAYTDFAYDPDVDGPCGVVDIVAAGATAKLTTVASAAGADLTDVGGVDLAAKLTGLVSETGSSAGRVRDSRSAPECEQDFSNTISQSYAVSALAAFDDARATDAAAYLLKQQCSSGAFREAEADTQCVGGGDVDTTGFAVLGLLRAKELGVTGLDTALAKARAYLVRSQRVDGAYAGQGLVNSNSTGMAASALVGLGRRGTAANSAAWLLRQQVRDAAAEGTALAGDLGAIAYTPAELAAAYSKGIGPDPESKWERATTQALIGLNALAPAKRLVLKAPNTRQKVGKRVVVTGGGLLPGERWTLTVRGRKVATGLANATGGFRVKVTVPKRKNGVAALKVTGSRDVRAGTDSLKIKR